MKNDNFFHESRNSGNELPAPLVLGAGALFGYMLWDNLRISVTRYTIRDRTLPKEFDGFRVAQISDLHGVRFGKRQSALVKLIESEVPDMIAITGDLTGDTGTGAAFELAKRTADIAPCFFVSGNHEHKSARYYSYIRPRLTKLGVRVLDDKRTVIRRNGASVNIIGLADPRFDGYRSAAALTDAKLRRLCAPGFTILLSHRPELVHVYSKHNVNVAFAGHAHGGQIRIPFLNQGVFAPQQMFFPRYTAGVFAENGTQTIISRGLGTETVIPRFNNPPELVIVRLLRSEL